MDRKGNSTGGASSPRGYSYGDEDVFDFPGVEDEGSGNGPVPREAHAALKEAFRSLKKRLAEAEVQNAELQAKLKQRDKKGSHSKVYQEKDELQRQRDKLQNHMQKSYLAFSEKYGENEQLKKIIQELKEALRLSQEAIAQGEGSAHPGLTSEAEGKAESRKYTTIIEELKRMGLEIIEENDQLFIILTDRDNLRTWIEEKSDGNITLAFNGSSLEGKATQTEGVMALQEGHEQTETERKNLEAEVILLKSKIQAQAEELSRFYKVFTEVMEQNLRAKDQKQQSEGLPTSMHNHAAAIAGTSQRTTAKTSTAMQTKAATMLATVKEQTAELKQVKQHLDKQNKSLRTLIDLTEKTTTDFSQLVSAPKPRDVPDSPGESENPQGAEGGAGSFFQEQGSRERNFERVFSDDAPLSIPVQETEAERLKNTRANLEFSNAAMYNVRLAGGQRSTPPSSAISSGGAEGIAVPMATTASEATWTGESDIEVIEEEEDFVGATSSRGKFCPICERFFPASFDQIEFELHVEQHFVNDP